MSNEYNRPFYEIVCGLNNYKLGTIIESETGQRYKLTKTDNDYRKFSRIDKGLRFLTYENMNKKFRIVEEQEEIDIQEINLDFARLSQFPIKNSKGQEEILEVLFVEIQEKMKELARKINYLDKNIKEKQ